MTGCEARKLVFGVPSVLEYIPDSYSEKSHVIITALVLE
jgi:hypothetical protein